MGSSHHPTKPKMEREDRERSGISLGFRVVSATEEAGFGMGILQEFLFVPWLKLLWVVCVTGHWHHCHHLRSLNSSPSCPGWAAICKRQQAFFKISECILIQILAKLAVLFVVSFFHIWISCNINWDWNHKSRISQHFHHHPFVFLGCNVGRVVDTNIVLEISKN